MKSVKKIISIFIILAVVISVLPANIINAQIINTENIEQEEIIENIETNTDDKNQLGKDIDKNLSQEDTVQEDTVTEEAKSEDEDEIDKSTTEEVTDQISAQNNTQNTQTIQADIIQEQIQVSDAKALRENISTEMEEYIAGLKELEVKIDNIGTVTETEGRDITLSGTWALPNDSEDENGKKYKAGESFTIKIPEGIEVVTHNGLNLGEYGEGSYNESERTITYTFTEKINGIYNRNGWFKLKFRIQDLQNNEESKTIKLDFIVNGINTNTGEVIVNPNTNTGDPNQKINDSLYKQNIGGEISSDGSIEWMIALNRSAELNGTIRLKDIPDDNQALIYESLKVQEYKTTGYLNNESHYKTYEYNNETGFSELEENKILYRQVDNGFELELPINEYGGGLRSAYIIYYNTEYLGEELGKDDKVTLSNSLTSNVIDYENSGIQAHLSASGGGFGNFEDYDIKILKVDSEDETKTLTGAEFTLTNVKSKEVFNSIEIKDEPGKYIFENLKRGNYILKEIVAPDGYELSDEEKIISITSKIADDETIMFENTKTKTTETTPLIPLEPSKPVDKEKPTENNQPYEPTYKDEDDDSAYEYLPGRENEKNEKTNESSEIVKNQDKKETLGHVAGDKSTEEEIENKKEEIEKTPEVLEEEKIDPNDELSRLDDNGKEEDTNNTNTENDNKENNTNNQEISKLPKTGAKSNIVYTLIGVTFILAAVVLNKKKK